MLVLKITAIFPLTNILCIRIHYPFSFLSFNYINTLEKALCQVTKMVSKIQGHHNLGVQ